MGMGGLQALEQFVGGYMNNNAMGGMMPAGPMGMGGPYGMYPAQPTYAAQGAMGGYGAPPACGGPGAYGMQQPMYPSGPQGGHSKPGTTRMRGLPFRSTVDDVFRFFQGHQITPGGIVLGQRDGRASGEAWVTFASPAEAQRAMSKNNTHMGNRYIELFAA